MYNPYQMNFNQQPMFLNDDRIPRVNGENGARALEIRPNGEKIALDINLPILWLITADSAGYKSISAYDIKPHKIETIDNYSDLEKRIKILEEKLSEPCITSIKQDEQLNTSVKNGTIID